MKALQTHLRKLTATAAAMNSRERMLVGAVLAMGVVFGIQQSVVAIGEMVDADKVLLQRRVQDLEKVSVSLKRYESLRKRREELERAFASSQMTFEQVVSQLDRVVRDSIGSDNYDLKRARTLTPFGLDFEKQDFTLILKTLTLDQLVKLLHQLEQGERPLFLSKIDLAKTVTQGEYTATLELFSIRRAASAS